MSSIVTLTFSPCIDKSAKVPLLIPEKKLQCSAPKLEPGGGGINVARALRRLGMAATAVYPSGGYSGKFLDQLMRAEGVDAVTIETEKETRENIIIVDASTNNQYRFGMPANALGEHEWRACLEAVSKISDIGFLIVSGSMPPGIPGNIFRDLLAIARSKNAKLVVDTSGPPLKEAVMHAPYLLKPNLGELGFLAGIERISKDMVERTARNLVERYHCGMIMVSMGKDGAVMVTKDGSFLAVPPDVPRKSTVGAGDSMLAGAIYSLVNGNDPEKALQYGVACGTAATMNEGTELCHKEDADRLYSMISRRERS